MTTARAWTLPLLAMLAIPSAPAAAANEPPRQINVLVYGDDPCPKSSSEDEIVVCARRPESERYRIPKELRKKPEDAQNFSERSWGDRVDAIQDATRFTMPNSCSPVGSYGQTGCWEQMLREWSAARKKMAEDAASAP